MQLDLPPHGLDMYRWTAIDTLLTEKSNFCWRSEHTEVISGSSNSSQSINSPELELVLFPSEKLDQIDRHTHTHY